MLKHIQIEYGIYINSLFTFNNEIYNKLINREHKMQLNKKNHMQDIHTGKIKF